MVFVDSEKNIVALCCQLNCPSLNIFDTEKTFVFIWRYIKGSRWEWQYLCDTNSHLCSGGFHYYCGGAVVLEMQEKTDRSSSSSSVCDARVASKRMWGGGGSTQRTKWRGWGILSAEDFYLDQRSFKDLESRSKTVCRSSVHYICDRHGIASDHRSQWLTRDNMLSAYTDTGF